jgi:hypothetical protein
LEELLCKVIGYDKHVLWDWNRPLQILKEALSRMIELANDFMSVQIDDQIGAQIQAVRNSSGRNALAWYDWKSPTPLNRGLSYGNAEQDWASSYRGGWQETIPNAGLVCTVDGIEMGFHGDASRSIWEVVDVSSSECHLRTSSRLPITIERWMRLSPDRASLYIEGKVTNLYSQDLEIVWGHHPAFPSVDGGIIDLPQGCRIEPDESRSGDLKNVSTPWPLATTKNGHSVDLSMQPEIGTHRLVYMIGHSEGWAGIRQPDPEVSIGMAWDIQAHPYIWLWTMRNTLEFPWFGRASMFALEAQSAWPYDGLSGASARGQALKIPAFESISNWYTISILPINCGRILKVNRDGSFISEELGA